MSNADQFPRAFKAAINGAPGPHMVECEKCDATGTVAQHASEDIECPDCRGHKLVHARCAECHEFLDAADAIEVQHPEEAVCWVCGDDCATTFEFGAMAVAS